MSSGNNAPTTKRGYERGIFVFGAIGMLVLAGLGVWRGASWYLILLMLAGAAMVLVATGRHSLGTAVYRNSDEEVFCRFIPWYRPSTIGTAVLLPIIGIAGIAMGSEGTASWARYAGYLLLAVGMLFALLALVQSANRLSFTPASLVIRMGRLFDIPRDRVVAIKPRTLTSTGTGHKTCHYDLVYDPGDGRSNRIMAMLDMQFSVDPENLATALQTWKDADPTDPGLMDRIEAILRGQHPAGHC